MKQSMKYLLMLVFIVLIGCGARQTQDSTQDTSQEVVAEQATVTTSTQSTQDAIQASGASVRGEVDTVITDNTQGIPTYWFIIGSLIFGMIIPQPRFIRWLF